MTIDHRTTARPLTDPPPHRQPAGVDYQRLFAEPPESAHPAEPERNTLDGMREQDPDAYRMVIYSWA